MDARAEAVLEFWFGNTVSDPGQIEARSSFWFGDGNEDRSLSVDRLLEQRFGSLVEQASSGQLLAWEHTPRERLALILLIDQFRRSVYRGTSAAFALDPLALTLAQDGLARGTDTGLAAIERVFFAMPLQHSESIEVQDESVRFFSQLTALQPEPLRATFENFARYARLHRDIIARYGRFPHRNAILGRRNTATEEAYLAGDAPRFGQRPA